MECYPLLLESTEVPLFLSDAPLSTFVSVGSALLRSKGDDSVRLELGASLHTCTRKAGLLLVDTLSSPKKNETLNKISQLVLCFHYNGNLCSKDDGKLTVFVQGFICF